MFHYGKTFGALVTDLPKALEYLEYKLSVAKLSAYGFNLLSLKFLSFAFFLNHYFNKEQRTKANFYSTDWFQFLWSSLNFNFCAALFLIVDAVDIASYTDDKFP